MSRRRPPARRGARARRDESPWVDVVVGVVVDGDRVLVARRPPQAHLGGLDEFPGGRREPGETLEEACAREVREEVGLAARPGRKLAVAWHADAERRLALTFFECACEGSTAIASDVAARTGARWVARSELASLAFPPANREVVRRLISERGGAAPPAAS